MAQTTSGDGTVGGRHVLAAVDESDNSRRAVQFLADFFAGDRGLSITLLSIIPEPSEDYFATDTERACWLDERRRSLERVLAVYRSVFREKDFADRQLHTRLVARQCVSLGEAILEERKRLGCSVVVVGRRGITHNEEFIFGSTSSKILHNAKDCAVMVIE